MFIGWLKLISGLVILILGGDFLVRSSVKLAIMLRISTLVIGLTVVAFGTSFPELVVSVNAALDGHPDIAIGNVVGSNIANLALVLGLTALITPLSIGRSTLVLEWPIMLAATVLFMVFAWDQDLVFWEGCVLTGLIVIYNWWAIRKSRREHVKLDEVPDGPVRMNPTNIFRILLTFVLSLAALIWGADLLVDGAVFVARDFGVEERVIAVTIIAFGTSAPELATSLIALYKNESSISVGNLIGSNIFNILAILGITSLIHPIDVNAEVISNDYYWILGIPLLLYPIMLTKLKVARLEGAMLLIAYITYIFLLF